MNSPSCLADYFTWPQVALTHHVNLSRHIEPQFRQSCKSPKLHDVQREAGEQRIGRNRVRILENNELMLGPVHVNPKLERIDQPAEQRTVFEVFHHLVAKCRESISGDRSSTTKSGQMGVKVSCCRSVRLSHLS